MMVPAWLKWVYLGFVVVLVPVYTVHHGLANFLWLSNVALIVGLVAVWRESRLLASSQFVSVGLLEVMWTVGFAVGLVRGGHPPFGLTDYMFDPEHPLLVRGLSLYHLVLWPMLAWLVWRLGYDARAWRMWLPIGFAIVVVAYFVADPERNVNWTHGPGEPQQMMPASAWLAVLLAGFAAVWIVTHLLIMAVLRRIAPDKIHPLPAS